MINPQKRADFSTQPFTHLMIVLIILISTTITTMITKAPTVTKAKMPPSTSKTAPTNNN